MRPSNMMTKFEKVKVIGIRALQLSSGAEPCIDPEGETNPLNIALMELRSRKIPDFKIRRYYPDNTYTDVSIYDLIID